MMVSPEAFRPVAADPEVGDVGRAAFAPAGPPRPATRPTVSWEALPNGTLIARVDGYRLVVRPGPKRRFRFVVLAPSPCYQGVTRVARGNEDTAERAMAEAERAVASLPSGSAPHQRRAAGSY